MTGKRQSAQDDGRWRYGQWGSVIGSVDFVCGVPLGIAIGSFAAYSLAVSGADVPILLALLAVDVALIAFVIAAHTLVSTLASVEYIEFLRSVRGGLHGYSRPYSIVVIVATLGALASLSSAVTWPLLHLDSSDAFWRAGRWIAFGIPIALTAWAIIGAAQLVQLGAYHLEKRAELLTRIAQVRALMQERTGEK